AIDVTDADGGRMRPFWRSAKPYRKGTGIPPERQHFGVEHRAKKPSSENPGSPRGALSTRRRLSGRGGCEIRGSRITPRPKAWRQAREGFATVWKSITRARQIQGSAGRDRSGASAE